MHVFSIPLRTRFRGITVREGVLLRGDAGWGEFSPFLEYDAMVAAPWWRAALEAAEEGWPTPVRDRVPVNVTVPAVDPSTASALVRGSGCRTAKVKVAEPGQTLADDVARVTAVREALGPDGHIRVDANAAWDVASASLAITRLAGLGLEYVEQPVATLEEMRDLRGRVTVPLAADESVRTAEDPLRIAHLDAADVLVLKVQPLGGVHRALEIADAAGLPVVVSSALETSVGLAAGLAFAAALPELPYACGLATASLLAGDVVLDTLAPQDGAIAVRRPVPDPTLLTTWAPGPDDAADLLQRLADADAAAGSFR